MEYKVLCNSNELKLSEQVTQLLSEGWTLSGSMQMAMNEQERGFSQALVRPKIAVDQAKEGSEETAITVCGLDELKGVSILFEQSTVGFGDFKVVGSKDGHTYGVTCFTSKGLLDESQLIRSVKNILSMIHEREEKEKQEAKKEGRLEKIIRVGVVGDCNDCANVRSYINNVLGLGWGRQVGNIDCLQHWHESWTTADIIYVADDKQHYRNVFELIKKESQRMDSITRYISIDLLKARKDIIEEVMREKTA